ARPSQRHSGHQEVCFCSHVLDQLFSRGFGRRELGRQENLTHPIVVLQHFGQAIEEEPGGIVSVIQQRRNRVPDSTQSAGHLAVDGVHVPPRVQIRNPLHLRVSNSYCTRHGVTSNESCVTRRRLLA